MEVTLTRRKFTDISTIGDLFINGTWQCFTIEDFDRGLQQSMPLEAIQKIKVYGQTCIAYGRYYLVINRSNRFSARAGHDVFTPLLVDVKGFEGIRIHAANLASELLGCIAPGAQVGVDRVINSRIAYNALFSKLAEAFNDKEDIFITIEKGGTTVAPAPEADTATT